MGGQSCGGGGGGNGQWGEYMYVIYITHYMHILSLMITLDISRVAKDSLPAQQHARVLFYFFVLKRIMLSIIIS